ncbi:hypothetical protein BH09ACT6_BH09ACT6_03310 [soil metagenome]
MRRITASASALWRIAGSGSVYTFAAWLFLYPFAVTILGGYDDARSAAERLGGFLIANAVHLLIGVGMIGGALLERRLHNIRARASGVLTLAVALGACRPLLIDGLQAEFHRVLYSGALPVRMATNVVVFVAALLTVAIITVSLRHHARVQRDLQATRAAIESGRADDSDAVDSFAMAFVADALATVRQTLARTRPVVFDREREAEALRQVSENVVRPLSHLAFDRARGDEASRRPDASNAFDGMPQSVPSGETDRSPAPLPSSWQSRRQLVAELARLRLAPGPIWAAPTVYSLFLLPFLLSHYHPGTVLALIGAGIAVGTAANAGMNRLWVSFASVWLDVIALFFASVAVGALVALSSIVVAPTLGAELPSLGVDLFAYPVIAVLVALARSGMTRLAAAESELAAVVREADRSAARALSRLVRRRESLARLLHTGVQGELTVTALRVREGIDGRHDVDAALVRVEELLNRPVPEVQVSAIAARENVHRIVAAWGTTIDIEYHADDDVWGALAEHPDRAALVVDALSEAFGNIIRHADAPRALVSLELCAQEQENVRLSVRSPGHLVPGAATGEAASAGYGLADLRRRAVELTLAHDGQNVVLSVVG